jgi:hypothetical protein
MLGQRPDYENLLKGYRIRRPEWPDRQSRNGRRRRQIIGNPGCFHRWSWRSVGAALVLFELMGGFRRQAWPDLADGSIAFQASLRLSARRSIAASVP